MTAYEFRKYKENRDELLAILQSSAFIKATQAFQQEKAEAERTIEAANLNSPAECSLRMHNQRIGFEHFVDYLKGLCLPIDPPEPQEQSDFGFPDALAKLQELEKYD